MTNYTRRRLNLDDLMDYEGIFDENGNLCAILEDGTEDVTIIKGMDDEGLELLFRKNKIKGENKNGT